MKDSTILDIAVFKCVLYNFTHRPLADTCSPGPTDPANGNHTVIEGDGTAFGSVVRYACFSGYQMRHGNPIVYCSLDDEGNPTWSEGNDVECVGELVTLLEVCLWKKEL